jgi:hypothetical protein
MRRYALLLWRYTLDCPRGLRLLGGRLARGLLAALSHDPDTTEQTLGRLIAEAQELAATPPAQASPGPS